MNNHYAAVTLGPDGSAYIATLAGMVRVKDRDEGRRLGGSGSVSGASREAVEDQVEPELELVAEVVAGLEDVLGRQLDAGAGTRRR